MIKKFEQYNESLTDKMTPKSEKEIEEARVKLLADLKEKLEDKDFPSEYFLQYLFNIYDSRKELLDDLLEQGMQITDILITVTDDLDFNSKSESEIRYKQRVKSWMYTLIRKNIDKLNDKEF
jgi:hypothetical protein